MANHTAMARVFGVASLCVALGLVSAAHAGSIDVLLIGGNCKAGTCTIKGTANQKVGDFVIVQTAPFNGRLQLVGVSGTTFLLKGTELFVGPAKIAPGAYTITMQVN